MIMSYWCGTADAKNYFSPPHGSEEESLCDVCLSTYRQLVKGKKISSRMVAKKMERQKRNTKTAGKTCISSRKRLE